MAKITLKGIVQSVSAVEFVGEKQTKKQTLILFVPGYVDQFGEKKGYDEHWPIDLLGESVSKLSLTSAAVKEKAECEVYVSGAEFEKKDGSGKGYMLRANLAKITLLGRYTNGATAPAPTTSAGDDDLPF